MRVSYSDGLNEIVFKVGSAHRLIRYLTHTEVFSGGYLQLDKMGLGVGNTTNAIVSFSSR